MLKTKNYKMKNHAINKLNFKRSISAVMAKQVTYNTLRKQLGMPV